MWDFLTVQWRLPRPQLVIQVDTEDFDTYSLRRAEVKRLRNLLVNVATKASEFVYVLPPCPSVHRSLRSSYLHTSQLQLIVRNN